ncbi:MAG: Rrf2 family transcriptional regulator [Cyanobacteria bacterium RUI128]|nr:Rrf2 family transcriptional regulator [Cyanobacteria bacterium RUI128]
MLKLLEGTAIALHSIVYINNKAEPATVKEISAKFEVSDNHLSKILQRFVREGVLVSEKGPRGGFSIKEEYKKMTLMEVYEIFEGKFQCHKCLFSAKNGDCIECIMSDLVTNMEKEFVKYMTTKTIADFTKCKNLNPN